MSGPGLDATQLERYARHVIMDEVGPVGQGKLLDASVLVVGAGGLGSPVIQYLAAAGVGRIGIVDDDVVERSNLHRQVIHGEEDVGRLKVDSAADFASRLNPDVTVDRHAVRLTASTAPDLLEDYDVVCDGSDNFATRYLVNDVCTLAGVPFVHGAIYKFEGQVLTCDGEGPCYRCLFPEAPPAGAVPDCASTGVLGVLPGTIGTLQATEVLKLILERGESLTGRMLVYDALGMGVDEVPIERDPECSICGPDRIKSIAEVEYKEAGCAIRSD